MEVALALICGLIMACGIYLMLRRNMVKFVFGLALISQAVNLSIFTAGELVRFKAPLIPKDENYLSMASADPLPQALILTAIVIGFGILAFTLILILRTYQTFGKVDMDEIRRVDK